MIDSKPQSIPASVAERHLVKDFCRCDSFNKSELHRAIFLYFLDVSSWCSHWLGVDVPDEDDLGLEAGVHGAPGLGPGRQHQQPVGLRHAALPAGHLHTRRLGHAHRLAPPEAQPHPGD